MPKRASKSLRRSASADKRADYLRHAQAPRPFDANDRLWQVKVILQQDVVDKRSIAEAAKACKPRLLVIVNAEDHRVNPQHALSWAAAAGAETYISHGDCAHLLMNCDADAFFASESFFVSCDAFKGTNGQTKASVKAAECRVVGGIKRYGVLDLDAGFWTRHT